MKNVYALVFFSAAVIPHTLNNTTLNLKKIGHSVNIEPDIMAKYSENMNKNANNINSSRITHAFLKEKGFI